MTLAADIAGDWESILSDVSEHAETITYTPANLSDPEDEPPEIVAVTIAAIFNRLQFDLLEPHAIRDVIECRLSHADLITSGITSPATRYERHKGDTITRGSETWEIIEAVYEVGMWTLTLEKNIRIIP